MFAPSHSPARLTRHLLLPPFVRVGPGSSSDAQAAGSSKEQRRSAAEEAATTCSDVRSTAEQQQGSTHSVRGTEGEGSLEMSELWLPRWHCPFLFWPRGGRKRRVGFWTWDCGWLMAINSISHLSSLPHYWVVAGLSWWVLPCCCSAVLLTSEQAVAASSAALRRCSFDAPSSRSPAARPAPLAAGRTCSGQCPRDQASRKLACECP